MNITRIEEKFKDCPPEITVQNIKECLKKVDIELEEILFDAEVGDCYSVNVKPKNKATLYSNGKGVTPDLARASGYAEFIERLQCGLLTYKYQSIARDPEIYLHTYAPDGKYMTVQELVDNGEWMDYIIDTYGGGLTRNKLAEQCKMYACTDDDKILTLPFYSLFEDKYVYLPAGFIEHMYSSNGCCAGNTRDEAWVHAFSEILERNSTIRIFTSKSAAPIIPDDVINQYQIPKRVIALIREKGNFDITIYDFSGDVGYPVVGTLLINKETQDYILNVSSDPVLEIALSRGLTEILQGRNITNINSRHKGKLIWLESESTLSHNLLNQLETGNGLLPIEFFDSTKANISFSDNSSKNNSQLLDYALKLFKDMGRPVYVRNYSFLGFNSYMVVVPGFSEARGVRLTEKIQEYGLGDMVVNTFRNPTNATVPDLNLMLMYFSKLQGVFSRRANFPRFSGLPMNGTAPSLLLYCTVSYASYKLGRYGDAARHIKNFLNIKYNEDDPLTLSQRKYLQILYRYLELRANKLQTEQIQRLLTKFFDKETVDALYSNLKNGENLYEGFVLKCDVKSCANCAYRRACSYNEVKDIIKKAGKYYNEFTDAQNKENFKI